MELKDYQERVLERLSTYLHILNEKKQDALDLAEARKKRKAPIDRTITSGEFNFCRRAWDELSEKRLIPFISIRNETKMAPHKDRLSGMGRPVPNICLKVPTGGGKTLLGTGSIERINTDFFKKNTGFVLWVVPSDSIYKQTLRALSDRESIYRQTLDKISGGKVKILEKTDSFHQQDVKQFLCVMLLMLQSAGRESKETLKIFKDSGRFPSFFPEVDDYHKNNEWLGVCKNLDTYDDKITIKHSLGNVLKLIQPIVIVDEGHRAYTEKAKQALMDFNPCFILELSATPNKKEHHSNVLVSVSGEELKKEEMIKLPINIFNLETKDWKSILSKSYEKLQNISKDTGRLQERENRYIRPIMLIRAERTGGDQRGKGFIHSEDVKEYLINNFNVSPHEIRIKSSSKDELGNENLLSEYSRVKYIITKDALKEGWDCPFAYVLTILSKTKAPVAIEQMIGRVLRQPYTKRTGIESLNQCYVFCMDQEVKKAIDGVRKGLENEGMDGLAGDIQTLEDENEHRKNVKIKRRKPFRGLKIFLPKILRRSKKGLRELSYEADLLYCIDWSNLKFDKEISLDDKAPDISHTQIDIKKQMELIDSYRGSEEQSWENNDMEIGFMCQRLSDIIPSPWDAELVINRTLNSLKKKYKRKKIYTNRFYILDVLRNDLQNQISQKTEKIFREKLKKNEILFKLVSAGDPGLNWEMAEILNLSTKEDSPVLNRKNKKYIQYSLFEDVYEKEFKFNDLEKNVAWYLDENSAIKWWHRIIEKQDWHLQGWQKDRIYPDFLVCLKSSAGGNASFSILETKGNHLMGNLDTEYKRKLFDLFTDYSLQSMDSGSIEIQDQKMTFDLVLESEWKGRLSTIFKV